MHNPADAGAARSQSSSLHSAAFDAAPYAALIADLDGRILDANSALLRCLGCEREALLQRSLEALLREESRETYRAALRAMSSCARTACDVAAKSQVGDAQAFQLELHRFASDRGDHLLCVLQDAPRESSWPSSDTRKVKREHGGENARARLEEIASELARSNTNLEHFAYVVSHDLQEPVRMVASYVRLLAEDYKDQLDETANLYIHFAHTGAMHMQNLIRDLLAYSRIGTRPKASVPVAVTECWALAVANLQPTIDETDAVVSAEPLPVVLADKTQLTEVLQNLLANALKFRRRDTPAEVQLSARRDGGQWVLSMRDNGIGIAREHAEEVFQVFRRLHTADEFPGTGMGLAIARRITDQHGGKIWIESEPGRSTTVHVMFRAA